MKAGIRSTVLIPVAVAASLSLAACAREISPDVVSGDSVGEIVSIEVGWIESARVIEVQEEDLLERNSFGVIIGGVGGGIVGSEIAGGGGWGLLATGAGILLGAALGALTEEELKRQPAMEYVVRDENGELYSIVQGVEPELEPGQRVYLQNSRRGRARLVPAD
jgi:outer membrane lipoprotein SlyB